MPVTRQEIQQLIAETIEELSQLIECKRSERMVEIDEHSEIVMPLTARIEERYTPYHLWYFAETADAT